MQVVRVLFHFGKGRGKRGRVGVSWGKILRNMHVNGNKLAVLLEDNYEFFFVSFLLFSGFFSVCIVCRVRSQDQALFITNYVTVQRNPIFA